MPPTLPWEPGGHCPSPWCRVWWKQDGTKSLVGFTCRGFVELRQGNRGWGPTAESRLQVNCAQNKRNKTGIVHLNGHTCIWHMKPAVRDRFHFTSPAQVLSPETYFMELPLMGRFDILGSSLIPFFSWEDKYWFLYLLNMKLQYGWETVSLKTGSKESN